MRTTTHDTTGTTDRDAGRPAAAAAADRYRFDTFRTHHMLEDLRYRRSDPAPGDLVPAFDLPTLDGGRLRSDALGARPVLLVLGSRTCPVTRSGVPRIDALLDEYGDRVRFVLVQTREAHPGDVITQPGTAQDKLAAAAAMAADLGVRHEVAVDDVDGTLHRALGTKPNAAYVLTPEGRISARIHWANDDRAVRDALEDVLRGRRSARRSRTVAPLVRAVGHLPAVVDRAGPKAARDVRRAAPPMTVLARVSQWFAPLPTDRRGPAAATVLAGVVAAVSAVIAVALG
ncbi:TlpA family protein disulfide reductase [Cellulomonas carbonis]|uniref:Alkyl hydroperoxide reductase n=1 Tax=Cellulomonas carbonis T26 TaxID=947969 RepID=A0A0A0BRD6_9CELL|nr:deiodinase-like protein [Cellulomonas carbonis]KGM10182.1 alkyl hydroperoxide reductase [Cellulomonas carbonis T26]GGC12556.1 hypothetical protein GCM10010972_27390 [Cellulomonas carbonis]